MAGYANILRGVVSYENTLFHFYNLQCALTGEPPSSDDILKFITNPRSHGKSLPGIASRLVGLYNLSNRQESLYVFNLSVEPILYCKSWDRIVKEFDPILEFADGIARKSSATPMNVTSDQVDMLEFLCNKELR